MSFNIGDYITVCGHPSLADQSGCIIRLTANFALVNFPSGAKVVSLAALMHFTHPRILKVKELSFRFENRKQYKPNPFARPLVVEDEDDEEDEEEATEEEEEDD